jgi:hypothetical protein
MNFISTPVSYEEPGLTLVRSIEESVRMLDNLVELIVFTPRGTFEADPDFGFEYWNHEYSNVHYQEFNLSLVNRRRGGLQNEITRKECEESVKQSLNTYEPMLKDVIVSIELALTDDKPRHRKKIQSKYEVNVVVEGKLDDGLGTMRPYRKTVVFMVEPTVKRYQ